MKLGNRIHVRASLPFKTESQSEYSIYKIVSFAWTQSRQKGIAGIFSRAPPEKIPDTPSSVRTGFEQHKWGEQVFLSLRLEFTQVWK